MDVSALNSDALNSDALHSDALHSGALQARLAQLSPERRALLERKMRDAGAGAPHAAAPGTVAHGTVAPGTTAPDAVAAEAISRRTGTGPVPLTPAQELLWHLDQAVPEAVAYNVPRVLRIEGAMNIAALQQALNELVVRHEALRTHFVATPAGPRQQPAAPTAVPFEVLDLRGTPETEREDAVRRVVQNRTRYKFDLASDLLLRATLIQRGESAWTLVLVSHHIVCDEGSRDVTFREISQLYSSFTKGELPALPALPVQFADYVVWQQEAMESGLLAPQLAYWREQLRALPPLDLPTDRARPATPSFAGARLRSRIPADIARDMRRLSQEHNVTLYMMLLATVATLLHRYSGQADFAIGTPISTRRFVELEGLIGYFPNVVVLRSTFDDNPTFAELLRQTREVTLSAFDNPDVPLERLALDLRADGRGDSGALVQALFVLDAANPTRIDFPGATVVHEPTNSDTAKFDILFGINEDASGFLVTIEYRTDLFEASTIERMFGHLRTLMQSVIANPTSRASELPLLEVAERTELITAWNDSTRPLPAWTVPARVLAQAAATPNAVAVRAGAHALSYGKLASESASLAVVLAENGISAGDRVALCVDRTTDLVVALLAVHRLGATYVPLDASYPRDRNAYVLDDAGVAAVIADAASMESLPSVNVPVVRLDLPRRTTDANIYSCADIDPESAAYVLYTSGSTGRPKGVVVPHRALSNFLSSMAERPGLTAEDAVVAVTTLAFDIAGLELWLPLIVGARVELASRQTTMDGRRLSELVQSVASHVVGRCLVQATPATWRLLIEAGWNGSPNIVMLCGGEAWPAGLAESLLSRGRSLWNVYGPTETTIWSTLAHVTQVGSPPLGEPLANTKLYVFERSGELAPVGVPGELCIGGAGLAHGYHNRPELTAERFPTLGEFGRVYRTGDLVVRRGNGRLEYLGRLDDQVKLRGHRIELGEIESALGAQLEVSQAIVVLREVGQPAEPQLVAYLVVAGAHDETLTSLLTTRLRAALPAYMVPAIFVVLDALPLTPNGKVDRRALPTPSADMTATVQYLAPRTALEELVVSLLCELLGRERVGVLDDLFAIGGHSLTAMRLTAKLSEVCGTSIPMRVAFELRTPEGIARWMESTGIVVDPELAAMMSELDAMSDEQAQALLLSEYKG